MQILPSHLTPETDPVKNNPTFAPWVDINYEPGEFIWTHTNEFRAAAIRYMQTGRYCDFIEGSKAYDDYWDREEERLKNGMVNSQGQWICGLMYGYLNYAIIYHKDRRKWEAPDFWDADAYFFWEYTKSCMRGTHFGGTKQRQRGYSLKEAWLLTNMFYQEPNSISYIGTYISDKGDKLWEMVEQMANHLDKNTAWHKNKTGGHGSWKAQFLEVKADGRKTWEGYKSELHLTSFKDSPSKGVGGGITLFVYEEPGLAPTLLKTVEYVRPTCEDGDYATGHILALGSVGELKDSKGLETICYRPMEYNFAAFPNKWDKGKSGTYCAFFHPAYWSYKGFMDENGNSLIEPCKKRLEQIFAKAKNKDLESYLLQLSQNPCSLEDAFQLRAINKFPVQLAKQQKAKLEALNYWGTPVELFYKEDGKVSHRITELTPVSDFPVKPGSNKRGCVLIYEFPTPGTEYGLYVAGVDPYKQDQSKYSESLGTIYIHKQTHGISSEKYQDEMVAVYTGRPDTLRDWEDTALMLLKFYNANALIENDVYHFIETLITRNEQKYASKAPGWIKEIAPNTSVTADYGVRATMANIAHFDNSLIAYCTEVIGHEEIKDEKGEIVRRPIYGIEKIKDRMLLEEMINYTELGGNYDRIRAYGICLAHSRAMMRTFTASDNNNSKYDDLYKYAASAKGPFAKSSSSPFSKRHKIFSR